MLPPDKIYGTGDRVIMSAEDDDAGFQLLEMGFDEIGGDFALYRAEDGIQALGFLLRRGRYVDAPKHNSCCSI